MAFFKNKAEEEMNRITCGYRFGNYLWLQGDEESAKAVWNEVLALAGDSRAKYTFACLAAEVKIGRVS